MDNRISQISMQPAAPKTTADEPFGAVLSRTVGTAANVVASTLGGGFPILSAALSGASKTGQIVSGLGGPSAGSGLGGTIGGVAGLPGATTGTGSSDSMALLQAQQALQEQGQSFNMQYLALQDQMQKESQQFTAISNVMKVRSDCAKSAINNIH